MEVTFAGNANHEPDDLQHTVERPGAKSSGQRSEATTDFQREAMRHETGSAELWHAIHLGDEQVIRRMVATGDCNARMRDASGHSVFWHAIAFGHNSIAQFLLDSFPVGKDGGIDIAEVHHKRQDTLLHLMCSGRNFGEGEAAIFRKLCEVAPAGVMEQRNTSGAT